MDGPSQDVQVSHLHDQHQLDQVSAGTEAGHMDDGGLVISSGQESLAAPFQDNDN